MPIQACFVFNTTMCLWGKESYSLPFTVIWEVASLSKILPPMSDYLKCLTLESRWFKHQFKKKMRKTETLREPVTVPGSQAMDRVSHKSKLTFWGFFFGGGELVFSSVFFFFIDIINKVVIYLKCTIWYYDTCVHCERSPTIELILAFPSAFIFPSFLWEH